MLKNYLKYVVLILLFFFSIGIGLIFIILYYGENIYINSVNNKQYFIINVCLKIRPKLIEFKVNEYSYGFENALIYRDFKMMDILEPYTKKFNFKNISKFEGYEFRVLEELSSGDFYEVLEYLFKRDLIRKKAELDRSYQEYLNYLLNNFARPPNDNNTGRILIKYGADPFYYEAENYFSLPIVLKYPEYLLEAYEKEGGNSLIKMKKLIKDKNFFNENQSLDELVDLKNEEVETPKKISQNLQLPINTLDSILKILNELEIRNNSKEDQETIKEIKQYIQ